MAKEVQAVQFSVSYAEKSLRDMPTRESILNKAKRVEVFKGSDALKYLMNKKGLLSMQAKDIMSVLLDNHYIVRVRPMDDQHILDLSYEFNINHEYIWIKEGSRVMLYLFSVAALLIALTLAMFPIWPRSVKIGTGYIFYLLIGLIAFLISITVSRAALYVAVWGTTGKHFWLFPNLYADCGILESFMPLYGWDTDGEEGAASASHQKAQASDPGKDK
ncbi:translocation protein SEC62 [Nematocida major]|uniref:translocation protein SEC62 n=1 Tax=Nematocida major TaxID=1912982 RepID=UPI002008AEC1|nr:translocation protein SEC62 [Nematocida major]KAH9386320.1 translocation protein SEC62 [Nematocida major]